MENAPPLKAYTHQTFEGQTLVLDYHSFEHCTITKCTIIYGGGPCHLNDNKIGDCHFEFQDAAIRTLQVYQTFFGGQPGIDERGNIKMA